MSHENLKIIGQGLVLAAILCFVLSMGSCFSCITAKREVVYDSPEQIYRKPDGTLGYGAKSHTTGAEGYFFYIVGFFVASVIMGGAGGTMIQKWAEGETKILMGKPL
jgi:hypothetical protein